MFMPASLRFINPIMARTLDAGSEEPVSRTQWSGTHILSVNEVCQFEEPFDRRCALPFGGARFSQV